MVVLSGAGVSAESGLRTFRDADGLWEDHDVTEVATPEAWARDRALVNRFYNARRAQLADVHPNPGHRALVDMEARYEVHVVTQNVDDLHERAGSTHVLHLHGELRKVRSTVDEGYVVDWAGDLGEDDRCPRGGRLRPHVVWFGEAVPALGEAAGLVAEADLVLIVGTSLQVYPAASLVTYAPPDAEIVYVDPRPARSEVLAGRRSVRVVEDTAARALPALATALCSRA